ncbi:MAG: mechanosensitive ion channel family protein, partial [Cyclobacteriaceae bacterium]
ITNLAGWLFILFRKPFVIGDRVQVGKNTGDIIDIRLFQFTMLEIGNWVDADQSTGRIIHIPNARVFSTEQANYSMGFSHVWNEIPVLLTFESSWKKAKEMLHEIATHHASHLTEEAEKQLMEASKRFMIFYSNLDPIVYTKVNDHGVLLTIRYLCLPQRRRTSEQNIWEEVLDTFAEHSDIEFAYPTQRFYNYPQESSGKTNSGNTF